MKIPHLPNLFVLCLCAVVSLLAPLELSATECTFDDNTPLDPEAPFAADLSFWKSSEVSGPRVPTDVDPAAVIEFTWTDPQECFAWVRNVSPGQGGGKRLNVATGFSLEFQGNLAVLTYVQNAKRCCDELECCSDVDQIDTIGTRKTFYSNLLTLDESTGQRGDPLQAAVTDFRQSYAVHEYNEVNALPAVSMQVRPSLGGDTITNDVEYPPGDGRKVVVGFWEHPDGYVPLEGENPCDGEPTMKIAYPLDYGSEKCYAWNHFTTADGDEPHENSAKNFSCKDGVFHYTQWTTMTCEGSEAVGPKGTAKDAAIGKCARDQPPYIWSQILAGCGKEPPRPDER